MNEVADLNRDGWDRRVDEEDVWTRPVSSEEISRARRGDWSLLLIPNKPMPRHWFGDVTSKRVFCLASGGGQQGPILAAAGAPVTIFDASTRQLAQNDMVARRDGIALETRQGLMHDLSCFADASFDLVFHPVSNCFAPEIEPVWRECFKVLAPGGALLAGFMNPDIYLFDAEAQERGELLVKFPLPYADVTDLPPDELRRLISNPRMTTAGRRSLSEPDP